MEDSKTSPQSSCNTTERTCTESVDASGLKRRFGVGPKTCLYCSLIRLATNKVRDRTDVCAILARHHDRSFFDHYESNFRR